MSRIYLDTTQKENRLILIKDGKFANKLVFTANNNSDSQLLHKFDDLLKKYNVDLKDISILIVNIGPGSFTGARNGITLANALKLARPNLKVAALSNPTKKDILSENLSYVEILTPLYSSEPTITRSKSIDKKP